MSTLHPRISRLWSIALTGVFFAATTAQAATLTVMSPAEATSLDTDDCIPATGDAACSTLRGAINRAQSGDSIVFDPSLDGQTIALSHYSNCLTTQQPNGATCARPSAGWPQDSTGQAFVSQFGPSAFYLHDKSILIDATVGLTKGVVLDVTAANAGCGAGTCFRFFDIAPEAALTLRGITLVGGRARGGDSHTGGGAMGAGGAIFNRGTLLIEYGALVRNLARGGQGAVESAGAGGAGVGASSTGGSGGGPNGGVAIALNLAFGGLGGGGGFTGTGAFPGGFGGGGSHVAYSTGFGGGGGGYNGMLPGFGGGEGSGEGVWSVGGSGAGMGGAVFNAAGHVTLRHVTLTDNQASGGAGASHPSLLQTFSGNGSGFGGALLGYAGSLALEFVTLAANHVTSGTGGSGGSADGAAIYLIADGRCGRSAEATRFDGITCSYSPQGDAALSMSHSIASGGTGSDNEGNIVTVNEVVIHRIHPGTVDNTLPSSSASGSNNMIGSVATLNGAASTLAHSTVAPKLGGLASPLQGGRHDVLAPYPDSPAVDAAGDCSADHPEDQRGVLRPQGAACDIGAMEVSTHHLIVTTADDAIADDGLCSLREALANANSNTHLHTDCATGTPDVDRITFDPTVFADADTATIVLAGTQLSIVYAGGLEIDGSRGDGGNVTISGDHSSRVFDVESGAIATLRRLNIVNGNLDGIDDGGGIRNNGVLLILDSTISNNSGRWGGGIYTEHGLLTIENSTLSNNLADVGGGIYSYGLSTIRNSTISHNSATDSGGGILIGPVVLIEHSTLSFNSANHAGGIASTIAGGARLHATLLSDNTATLSWSGDNCHSSIMDEGHNLSSDESCAFTHPTSISNSTANLGPLQDNGGPTHTHLPGPGSDALGKV